MRGDDPVPPGGADPGPAPAAPAHRGGRRALWLLLLPAVGFVLSALLANRPSPLILGLPPLVFGIAVTTILTPFVITLVARLDPLFRSDAGEPVPADAARAEAAAAPPAPGPGHDDRGDAR